MDKSEYINLRILSERLGRSPRTLRNWLSDPTLKLPAYRINGRLLFKWVEIDRWIEKFRVETADVDAEVNELLKQVKSRD